MPGASPYFPVDAATLLADRSASVERTVCEAYASALAPIFPEKLAVLAVGGFGRRELFPHSDVDLLLLVEKEPAKELHRTSILAFLQRLWDSGLRASHSVRTPDDCCEIHTGNLELNVSLLDQRFLAGDAALYGTMCSDLARFLHGQRDTLARLLCQMARERHARHNDSIHQLEPNIKEAPGGLRDYQLIRWLGQLRNAQVQRLPCPEPLPELQTARDFLYSLRCYLHLREGRDQNLLSFDAQEEAAGEALRAPAGAPELREAAAGCMRAYFRHAREIYRTAIRAMDASEEQTSTLLAQFRDWRSRVSNAEFFVSRERIYFRAPRQLEQDPELALRLFQFAARHGFRLAADTERRVSEYLPGIRRYFSASRPLWPALNELFSAPSASLALRAMEESGVLGAVFPEWNLIECLVVRDFHHRYTVDEHTLRAIRVLADLRASNEPQERRFADLLSEIDDPGVLVFALLFHDTGKSGPPGEHATESARLAECAMDRIRMPARERRMVRALIELHLELSAIMNSRDLDDPSTARYLAGRVETIEVLKRLALVTYADISAVHPGAMTSWRREQLWRAYVVTYNELTREMDTERIAAPPHDPEKAEFLEGLPVRYLRAYSPAEIESHLELQRRARVRGMALDVRKLNGVYQLTLVARDRPFLLASIAGALSSLGMNILKAEGYANRSRIVLDTFTFSDPHRTLELNPSEMDRLRLTLERVMLGKTEIADLLRSRPKPAPPSRGARVSPAVSFDGSASETATLIGIVAQDRPGLLYDVARTLSSAGCNVELVLIDTEAHKALDVFYVTSAGRKLDASQQDALRERLLAVCGNP